MLKKLLKIGMAPLVLIVLSPLALAEELCAEVKIEILQELTMERQGFEALMRVNNSLDSFELEDVSVSVNFEDDDGNEVVATSDTSASDAAFFIRLDGSHHVSGLETGADGLVEQGVIAPNETGELRWLIIPTANAAGQLEDGELYYVGARLSYSYGGKEEVVEVAPDSIVVKPQPALTLDYFLTREIIGDDAFTTEVEPLEPYTLGVRLSNNGYGVAQSVNIESAQPTIIENDLGLAVDFKILGSYLGGEPADPSLLINFGDIQPEGVKNGRWIMETSLSGEFTAFTASFTHADELGGELTSLLEATNAHFLKRDVLVDLPGRDSVRDFLAYGPTGGLYVYESENTGLDETICSNCAEVTELPASLDNQDDTGTLTHNSEAGFSYAQVNDPYSGTKVLERVVRSDGKVMNPQNAWLSKARADDDVNFDYFINIFDVGSTGEYILHWGDDLVDAPQPPVIRQISPQVTHEGGSLGFLVLSSDPNGTTPSVSAGALPTGAELMDQGDGTGVFQWNPQNGQAGVYSIDFIASDGALTTERSVNVQVNPWYDTDGDGMDDDWEREHFGHLGRDGTGDYSGNGRTDLQEFQEGTDPTVASILPGRPQIKSPLFDADTLEGAVGPFYPELIVTNSTHATGIDDVDVLFEIYGDEGLSEPVAAGTVAEGEETTSFQVAESHMLDSATFTDNTLYYWRARAINAENPEQTSGWVKSRFFINSEDSPPSRPQISSPEPESIVDDRSPILAVTNSSSPDRSRLYYSFSLYAESDLDTALAEVSGLAPGVSGETAWRVPKVLEENTGYLWQAKVTSDTGQSAESEWGFFLVSTENGAPTNPQIHDPEDGAIIEALDGEDSLTLTVANAEDPERQPLSYYFELDTAETFDTEIKQSSGPVAEADDVTAWSAQNLQDGERYYWRVRAFDGDLYSDWARGQFTVSMADAPLETPVLQNPVADSVVARLQPVLEVNPVDAEDRTLTYRFELYAEEGQTGFIAEQAGPDTQWSLDFDLDNGATYYWRARAEDDNETVSEWSPTRAFSISVPEEDQPPELEFVLPDEDLVVGDEPEVLIQWVDSAPDNPAGIALYYSADSETPVLIESGIEADPDGEGDQYLWDTTGLAAGDYKISAIIADEETEVNVEHCCTITIETESSHCEPTDPEADLYPEWESSTAYSQGQRVSYDGLVWEAKWWSQNGPPPSGNTAWSLVSDVELPWASERAYDAGEEVNYNGRRWRAKWWTQGEEPGTGSAWEEIGPDSCEGSDTGNNTDPEQDEPVLAECNLTDPNAGDYPTWSPEAIYEGGSLVNFDGLVWKALWWNIGSGPESAKAPWVLVSDVDYPWSPSLIYRAGDEVNHGDHRWQAQWWVQGEEPGQNSAWAAIGDPSCTYS